METDAERKQLHDELARRAQAIRDKAANEMAARTPGVLDALDRLSEKVEGVEGQVGMLREGLAAAYAAADPDGEEEAPQPRRRDHLRLVRNDDLQAG